MKNEKIVIANLNATTITLTFRKNKFKMNLQEILDEIYDDTQNFSIYYQAMGFKTNLDFNSNSILKNTYVFKINYCIDLISNLILRNSRIIGATFIKINDYDLIKLETDDMTNDEYFSTLDKVRKIIFEICFLEEEEIF